MLITKTEWKRAVAATAADTLTELVAEIPASDPDRVLKTTIYETMMAGIIRRLETKVEDQP
ncbi:MAG: hypothetical protein ACKVP0_05610 [Pirellulaceae bacterium]